MVKFSVKGLLSLLTIIGSAAWVAAVAQHYEGPVIDMHYHASGQWEETIDNLLAQMEKHNVVLAVLNGANRELMFEWQEQAPASVKLMASPSFPCAGGMYPVIYPCFTEEAVPGWPDIEWLEMEIKSGRVEALGELLYVYYGISPDHEQLMPYWELAARYDLPVGVHAAHGPPADRRKEGCCPDFDAAMGNPVLLKPVLDKYPGLRIWLMHAGEIQFHRQAVELMKAYPNVYADMSILNSVMPVEMHARFLKDFLNEGLEDRIMFGSDNLPYELIIGRLRSFDFLTEEQERKILYENASRFLQLITD